jgi:signal transduction histidine kinase
MAEIVRPVTHQSSRLSLAFKLAVVLPVIFGIGLAMYRMPGIFLNPRPHDSLTHLLFWTMAVGVVELLPVPVSPLLRLSLSFPILLAVAILYESPFIVGAVTLLGLFDPREIRREIPILTAMFNRCQTALAFAAGNVAFHSVASLSSRWYVLLPSVVLATITTYLVNVSLVAVYTNLVFRVRIGQVIAQLRVGAFSEFLLSYLGLGFVGVIIASLYQTVGLWSVAAFILPLVFARQMFFRNIALEEASKELKDREQVLRALSNRMAEERQDERMQIAAYLHDDLAQMLFRLTLQAEMAKKRLAQGEVEAVERDLDGIMRTKQETSDAIRALIRDLHRSPIGRRGLAEAIQSLAEDMSRGHLTTVSTEVVEVSLPPPIQLLIYQISREAAMNALKHAEAAHIWITLEETEDGVRLQIRDDGKGFDTAASPPEGHFGSVMMRERALVAGGTFSVESQVGEGTTIAANFPRVWVEEGSQLEAAAAASDKKTTETKRPPVGSTTGPGPAGKRVPAATGLTPAQTLQPNGEAVERGPLTADPVGSSDGEPPEEIDAPAAKSGPSQDGERSKQHRQDRPAVPA